MVVTSRRRISGDNLDTAVWRVVGSFTLFAKVVSHAVRVLLIKLRTKNVHMLAH